MPKNNKSYLSRKDVDALYKKASKEVNKKLSKGINYNLSIKEKAFLTALKQLEAIHNILRIGSKKLL